MRTVLPRPAILVVTLLTLIGAMGCAPDAGKPSRLDASGGIAVSPAPYNGWPDAIAVRNKSCELIVVPAVSRVMSFRLTGRPNLLWESPALAGKTFATDPKAWQNIGGEKLWPTQQNLFGKFTGIGYDWPPPWPWDAGPSKAQIIPGGVRLTLPHDARFGAHAVREFTLVDADRPIVRVRQWIEKTAGEPAPFTVWTVAQVNDPSVAFASSPDNSYTKMGPDSPQIDAKDGRVALGRLQDKGLKVGVKPQGQNGYVAALFKQPGGKRPQLLVQSHRLRENAEYPDKGMQAELYTSPTDFARYTELELLGPLVTLKAGERARDDAVWQIVETDEAGAVKAAAEAHETGLSVLKE